MRTESTGTSNFSPAFRHRTHAHQRIGRRKNPEIVAAAAGAHESSAIVHDDGRRYGVCTACPDDAAAAVTPKPDAALPADRSQRLCRLILISAPAVGSVVSPHAPAHVNGHALGSVCSARSRRGFARALRVFSEQTAVFGQDHATGKARAASPRDMASTISCIDTIQLTWAAFAIG